MEVYRMHVVMCYNLQFQFHKPYNVRYFGPLKFEIKFKFRVKIKRCTKTYQINL